MSIFSRKKRLKEKNVEDTETTERIEGMAEIFTAAAIRDGNREYQQDALYVSHGGNISADEKSRFIGAVCDGMGGMADGGRASRTAIDILSRAFDKVSNEDSLDIPAFFKQGIITMDKVIHEFPQENGRGSGTTFVSVIIEGNRFYWASVGDSRIYFFHDNQLQRLTRDHNYDLKLQSMLRDGSLSQEEYEHKTQKEALISFLGMGDVTLMDISDIPTELSSGDCILLCSDGVTKTLRDDQLLEILMNEWFSVDVKADQIVDAAIHSNTQSQDNTSVVLMRYV